MVRSFFAAVMTLALGGIVRAETYNIQVWPDDLDKVPCEAWKKNPDGSLTQTGTIVVANSHSVITGNTFKDAPTIRVVERNAARSSSSRRPTRLTSKPTKPPAGIAGDSGARPHRDSVAVGAGCSYRVVFRYRASSTKTIASGAAGSRGHQPKRRTTSMLVVGG